MSQMRLLLFVSALWSALVLAIHPGERALAATPAKDALIEEDWRLQDGIGTSRKQASYSDALAGIFRKGDLLLTDLRRDRPADFLSSEAEQWEALKGEFNSLAAKKVQDKQRWEDIYLRAHRLGRRIALSNPLMKFGPILFAKQVPGAFSHQLTQYYGRYARPGGSIFVLVSPGKNMKVRDVIADQLGRGSFQHPELSYDGKEILFSFCAVDSPPKDTIRGERGRYYHVYEIGVDGTGLTQLTDGPYDDFSPRYLPNGQIVFISTRRGGWHRCGNPGCEVYTLAIMESDGSNPRPMSFHESHEWDPSVLDDGRIIYTRWDYVDRHAVHYEHLWSCMPDGTGAAAYFGNNTLNPVGVWEARQVPGANLVVGIAGPHHGMTAGSIVLVDIRKGVDGLDPLIRVTPDVPFPESETPLAPHWRAGPCQSKTPEYERWPGHCYKTPYPLSEKYFLAAYSFKSLIGEPKANPPDMFGVYLVDAFGNKELLYRDPEISSISPIPLRSRPRPPVRPSLASSTGETVGLFICQDVYRGMESVPRGSVKALRIVQVLPKSTPGINNPRMGLPNGTPGKRVLGTVPVEADGSAYFRAPAGVLLCFQALDKQGLAAQVMRSAVYLQHGETMSCVGCHEYRTSAPLMKRLSALQRPPSIIKAGPDGSNPLSYPLLVQPVLDKHCVRCHSREKAEGKVVLTGEIERHFTVSYNALAPRVPYSDNNNIEPVSRPGRFGARGSKPMQMLLKGHEGVKLAPEEIERLATWMDANVLFYGVFDHADQARQQRGERVAGPALQ